MRIVTAEEMRRLDRYAIQKVGIPEVVLMESAGRSVYAELIAKESLSRNHRILVVAGTGNNGGDGFVIARYLHLNGYPVDVCLVGATVPKSGAALRNFDILRKIGVTPRRVRAPDDIKKIGSEWDVIIDALFGTGISRKLGGIFLQTVEWMNRQKCRVYAVDIPSGLHSDTGETMGGCVKADVTVTFACKKRGFFLSDGPEACGDVAVADISISDLWADKIGAARVFETRPEDVEQLFSARRAQSHKGTFGHVLVIAGSAEKSGAAVLASRAALRSGAGLVTLATPRSAHSIVKSQLVEVMTEPIDDLDGKLTDRNVDRILELCEAKNVVVIGPGLALHSGLRNTLSKVLAKISIPVVLDAEALNALGKDIVKQKGKLDQAILTPHPGEMSRLTGRSAKEVQSNRIDITRELSDSTGAHVILKGANTIVALAKGDTFVNSTGNPAMATAGMGDVLAGIIGSYVAQGLPVEKAAVAAVFHHGLAGDRVAGRKGERGILANDVIEELPGLFGKS